MLQCVAVCCSVLQCVRDTHSSPTVRISDADTQTVAVCCSVLQCVAVCCSVCETPLKSNSAHKRCRHADCCSVLQCVAVCCSVLQCERDTHSSPTVRINGADTQTVAV